MDVHHTGCARLDVHKDTMVAGVRIADGGPAKTEVRTFDTATPGLLALSAWLAEQDSPHLAMKAISIPWRPVWHVLCNGEVTLILANLPMSQMCPAARPTWSTRSGWPTCWRAG